MKTTNSLQKVEAPYSTSHSELDYSPPDITIRDICLENGFASSIEDLGDDEWS